MTDRNGNEPDARDFEHQSIQDATSLAGYLRAVIDGFSKGTLRLNDRGGEIVLGPRGLIQFGVQASRRRGRNRLVLEFTWKDPGGEEARPDPLRINGESR